MCETIRRFFSMGAVCFIAALTLLTIGFPTIGSAQYCTGGSGGGLVLKTITMDAAFTDWDDVLANPAQVSKDDNGAFKNLTECGLYSTDRDCPVGSTGRDLNWFAWTYDGVGAPAGDGYVYLYCTRYGSSTNVQDFWFYMDVNQNQRMEATDFLLNVNYSGSNQATKIELFRYAPVDTTLGDPMVDTNGWADGYDIVGDVGASVVDYGTTYWGFTAGDGFEARVPWADLGISEPAAIFFHVAASGGSNIPSSIEDNAGSPDGKIGYFGYYNVDIEASGSQTLGTPTSDTPITFTHTITNNSIFTEIINLKVTSTSGFMVEIYDTTPEPDVLMATDYDGDGIFTAGRTSTQPTIRKPPSRTGSPIRGPSLPAGSLTSKL